MLELILAGAALAAAVAVLVWLLRRAPPLEGLRAEQARILATLEQLAQQGSGLAAASQAQQQSVAALLEGSRAQQGIGGQLQASVAEHRQQVGELKAAVEASAQGLAEVKLAQQEQRVAQAEARNALAEQLQQARQLLERVDAEAKERALRAQEAFDSLARLEAIIAGTKSRGTAGENLLAEVIQQLPPEFRAYDVRIGGKQVEFAIPLPNGRYLPVDSKWTSADKLARLAGAPEEEKPDLIGAIQEDVEAKVGEVAKYLDPDKTCMMAVLAVPDAVFELCARAHVTALSRGVVIVPYSMAVPYVLSVLQVIQRFGARVDEAQLSHAVRTVLESLTALSDEVEGRLSRAISSLENSRRDLRGHVGKAQQALHRVRVEGGPNGAPN